MSSRLLRTSCAALFACATVALALSCSDAGLYALDARGPGAPDRADLAGTVCVPLAAGPAFPVKVLFAVEGGSHLPRDVVGQLADALASVPSRFAGDGHQFALVAFHTVATGLQGSFTDAAGFQSAAARYNGFQEQGPLSLRAPLRLASSLLSGDMLTGCQGTVARTRYLVVPIIFSADTSCANPAFNAGIDARCNALLPDQAACSACELTRVTTALEELSSLRNAGEVVVQPIYVRTTPDPLVRAQIAAIARAGGSQVIETDPGSVREAVNSINYAGLQAGLTLKRVFAFNRNVISRGGERLVDSDGDGIPDDDEVLAGSDPRNPDTDGDGLMDGVERRMGMDVLLPDVLTACNPALDSDGDRLTDCEERVLGTDACTADTDGDGFPELVELLSGTNPLSPERLQDEDRDGRTNVEELASHTDPLGADLAYARDNGYDVFLEDAPPTSDGRACFDVRVRNIPLAATLSRPDPPFADIEAGTNDVYVYVVAGRPDDAGGAGISSLFVERFTFTPPGTRSPEGTVTRHPGGLHPGPLRPRALGPGGAGPHPPTSGGRTPQLRARGAEEGL